MNTTPDRSPSAIDFPVTNAQNDEFIQILQDIVNQSVARLNHGELNPATVVALGICTVQLQGVTTSLFSDSSEKPVNPGLRMAAAILQSCIEDGEADSRVLVLVKKAKSLADEALRIRTGEIISTTLH
jgi:hypothetical protein